MMHRLAGSVLLVAYLFASDALAQVQPWMNKLDHHALLLITAQEAGEAPQMALALDEIVDVQLTDDGPMVGTLIRLRHPGDAAALVAAGMTIETLAGDVAVGVVPVRLLAEIAALPETQSLSIAQLVDPLNDLATASVRLDEVHAGMGLPAPYRGQGVAVGVLDTGIDFTHPDFSDENGSRIEFLLEFQPDDSNNPPLAQQSWTRSEIEFSPGVVTQRDIHGHGTHVTGTAAGGGRAAPYAGAAPESRLLVVKGSRTGSDTSRLHTFSERDMVNGIAWIFDRAAELNMPAVVNMSIGAPGGPLDGSMDVNRAMTNLTGPGRLIVFAAGNNGVHIIHAGEDLVAGTQRSMAFAYSSAANAFVSVELGRLIQVQGWYDPGAVASVSVEARDPNSGAVVASTALPVGAGHSSLVPLASGGAIVGYVRILAQITSHPNNGLGTLTVQVADNNDSQVDLTAHFWSVTVDSPSGGRVDAWIPAPTMGAFLIAPPGVPGLIPGDNQFTLNRFAAAEGVLTTGSYTTRREWTDANGNPITATFAGEPQELHVRTHFSSFGPTRDGRVRPDVVSPGAWLISTRSQDAPANASLTPFELPRYALSQGTSMAAPVLTGTVALLLQVDPSLGTERTRDLLVNTAREDQHTGSVPNTGYGHGKLDAFAAVQALVQSLGTAPGGDSEVVLQTPYPNPTRREATIIFTLTEARSVTLTVHDLLGREVRRLAEGDLPLGPHRYVFSREGLAAGPYFVTLTSDGRRHVRQMMIVN